MTRIFKSPGFVYALIAACLFGASTPISKLLLTKTNPLFLAGILYLGSGVGLAILILVRAIVKKGSFSASLLSRRDIPWLAGSTGVGGILAPILLMNGLARLDAASASLFLNMESVLTACLAWAVFKEHVDRRIFIGMALIITGGLVLSWTSHPTFTNLAGPLLIAGACLAWAIDNNLTRKISANDPVHIATIKSLVAGMTTLTLAMTLHISFPPLAIFMTASVVGFISYGLSLSAFILALRHIGTSRTGALFSLAPFVGTVLAIIFLGESLSARIAIAGALMGLGAWLHVTETHIHEHHHEAMEHEHMHVHDAHHQHTHYPDDPPGEPHRHWHRHEALVHTHRHYPDLHHRHRHE